MSPSKLFNAIATPVSYLPHAALLPAMGAASYVATAQLLEGVPSVGSAAACAFAAVACVTLAKAAHLKQTRHHTPI